MKVLKLGSSDHTCYSPANSSSCCFPNFACTAYPEHTQCRTAHHITNTSWIYAKINTGNSPSNKKAVLLLNIFNRLLKLQRRYNDGCCVHKCPECRSNDCRLLWSAWTCVFMVHLPCRFLCQNVWLFQSRKQPRDNERFAAVLRDLRWIRDDYLNQPEINTAIICRKLWFLLRYFMTQNEQIEVVHKIWYRICTQIWTLARTYKGAYILKAANLHPELKRMLHTCYPRGRSLTIVPRPRCPDWKKFLWHDWATYTERFCLVCRKKIDKCLSIARL